MPAFSLNGAININHTIIGAECEIVHLKPPHADGKLA
jgi:hypothetical protein